MSYMGQITRIARSVRRRTGAFLSRTQPLAGKMMLQSPRQGRSRDTAADLRHWPQPLKLHLGSGPYRFDGWANIDLDSPNADLRMDLRAPLPFPNNSVRFIFAEHFIEHITRDEGVRFLTECKRVLSQDGIIRLSTPNLRWLVEVYLKGDLFSWEDVFWRPPTACKMINEGMRAWGHQFLYDRDELRALLNEAGLTAQRDERWRESRAPDLRGLEQRPYHNELIVEAGTNLDFLL